MDQSNLAPADLSPNTEPLLGRIAMADYDPICASGTQRRNLPTRKRPL